MKISGIFDAVHLSDANSNSPEKIEFNQKRNALLDALREESGLANDKNAYDLLWEQRVARRWEVSYLRAIAGQRKMLKPPKEGEGRECPK